MAGCLRVRRRPPPVQLKATGVTLGRSMPESGAGAGSGRRPGCLGRLPRNRTCAVRIRLFGMAGYYPPSPAGSRPRGSQRQTKLRRGVDGSILAGPTLFSLLFAFRAFCSRDVDRSISLLHSAPRCRGFSAVAKFSLCCRSSSLTGTAFPPSDIRVFRVWPRFPGAFGTMRSSDFCWAIGFRLSSYDLPLSRSPAALAG